MDNDEAQTTIAELLEEVGRDRVYYQRTQGGVTLSGGEPLAQNTKALLSLLQEFKAQGMHVAVETAGDVPFKVFESLSPLVDLFLFDLKVVGDPDLHRTLTGRDGVRIEENLKRLANAKAKLAVRMCVVPDHNDSLVNLEALAELLKSIGLPTIELMRHYDLHQNKARHLEPKRPARVIDPQESIEALQFALDTLSGLGIAAYTLPADVERRSTSFSKRVRELQRQIREAGYAVCLESATLKTEFHKKHGFERPLAVQRAELLRHVLNNKQVVVYPHELLVGNYTSKRVAGSVWLEYFGALMMFTLWNIDRQKPIKFECSLSDKLRFYTRLAPFWVTRGLYTKVFPNPMEILRFSICTVERRSGFNNNMAGIAHYVVNCERLLKLGTSGLAREAQARSEAGGDDQGFYRGVGIALSALEEFAARYAQLTSEMAAKTTDPTRRVELEQMAQVCRSVPKNPANSFHEALQSILFWHIALCTESFENAISFGRLDQVLYPYFKSDLEAGLIDHQAARELIACFTLKLDELVFLNDGNTLLELGKLFESLSTVETVTVGGVDRSGRDATNDVTYMILEACELKPIGINMAARIHADSPDEYLERIASIYLNGSPMPALYNDEVYIPALLQEYETTLEDARNYSIVGCVEPVASDDHFANTDSANVNLTMPFLQALRGESDRLWGSGPLTRLRQYLRRTALGSLGIPTHNGKSNGLLSRAKKRLESHLLPPPPESMEQLLAHFEERLGELVRDLLADQQRIELALADRLVTPLASALYPGCMERGRDVYQGGTTINSSGIQAVGVVDVADSLAAIDELVFRQKRYSLAQLLQALDDDFEGHEQLRADLLAVPKFGDDRALKAHHWVNRVLKSWVEALRSASHPSRNGKYVAGYYGLNVNRIYGYNTPALPSGRKLGVPLANSICPHFGMQMVDLSSALNSVAQVDFARFAPNGTTLTSTVDSGLFPGSNGVKNLAGLIEGFFAQGGMQFQPNVIDRQTLLDAYRNPGKYKDLVVRIAGYCAYFDNLSDELKREIIDRSYYTHRAGQ